MPSKLQYYQSISEQAAREVTAKRGNWMNFLDTASKMYKYSFTDQLMIHAQRPNAVACAQIETWNDSFNRWVRRGAKGIALIDDTGNYPRLKYVFDVADTEPSLYNSRPVNLWEMRQEHREPVLKHLAGIYDDIEDTLSDSFRNIATQLANEYYEDNAREIRFRAEDSFLEDFDDYNLSIAFKEMLANSIAYTLMSRCGFDTAEYFEDEDFQYIFDFNTPDMVYALGTATSELSEQVLRDIEIVIKKYERVQAAQLHTAERSNENEYNLHTGRGLSSPRHQAERAAEGVDGTSRTVRTNEEIVSERPQDDNLQHNAAERNLVSAPSGNGASGELPNGTSNEPIDQEQSDTQQSGQSDGLDSGNERLTFASGGNGSERTDLRLNQTDKTPPQQYGQGDVSDINDTYSQVGNRDGHLAQNTELLAQVSLLAETISTSSIALDEVDSILRDGGNDKNSTLRIASFFSKGLSPKENADFLRREYLSGRWSHRETHGGKGFQFGIEPTSVWFDDNGIKIGRGKSAQSASDFAHITWEQAAARIKSLYDAGQYVSHDVLDEAVDNAKRELAEDLWYFYRDDMNFIPEEWDSHKGHLDDIELIKGLLGDIDEREGILARLEGDVISWKTETDGRTWHNPEQLLSDMKNSMIPTKGFPVAEIQSVGFMRFITEDEIDSYLTSGSQFSEGKFRILSHFLHDHTPKGRINFLKNEYGHVGGSWVGGGWHGAEPGKGMYFKRPGCEDINLNWNQVSRRIGELIQSGLYMTRSDLNRIPDYEALILTRNINNFYYNLPSEEYNSPFQKELDFYYPHKEEWTALRGFLSNTERIDAVLGEMQYLYANTPEEDRYYSSRKTGFERLTAYREGTYTLFPGLDSLPQPELANKLPSPILEQRSTVTPSQDEMQISLFDIDTFPVLPSTEAQQIKIEQSQEQTAEANAPAVSLPISQDGIDTLLLNISNEDKTRLAAQFADNPRSKEAVQLVREIYSGNLPLPLPQAIRRITELANAGRFAVIEQPEQSVPEWENSQNSTLTVLDECHRIKVENNGAIVMWQVGDFFEMYGEDANIAVDVLNVTVTERKIGLETVPMCGIPRRLLGEYERKLNEAGHAVAVASSREEGSRNITVYAAKSPVPHIPYNVGDKLTYNGKQYEIDRIDDFVRIRNLATLPTYPISDYVSFQRYDFERLLSENQIVISNDEIPGHENAVEQTPELDFDTVAQTVLERVMQDTDYLEVLSSAQSRASLRNPCTWALEQSIRDHQQDEPEIYHRYFSDEDFNDNLFDYVLRQSWANRPIEEIVSEQPTKPQSIEESGDLDEPTERFEVTMTSDAFPSSEDAYAIWDNETGDYYTDEHGTMPTFADESSAQEYLNVLNNKEMQKNQESAELTPEQPQSPLPVFFVDWKEAQFDFDLKLYGDGDIIGYDKKGVEFALGRSGSLTYITNTTMINPFGDILGDNDIPRYIREQMIAYRNGDLSDEQVKKNYLQVLSDFKAQHEAAANHQHNEISSEYVLDYRYVNDRLIVSNIINADPDELPPVVARVEPDGSIIAM